MKKKPATLILHGQFKEHDMGQFPSITAAKKAALHLQGPTTIKPIEKPLAGVRECFRTGQYFPTIDGNDISPSTFSKERALEIAQETIAKATA